MSIKYRIGKGIQENNDIYAAKVGRYLKGRPLGLTEKISPGEVMNI